MSKAILAAAIFQLGGLAGAVSVSDRFAVLYLSFSIIVHCVCWMQVHARYQVIRKSTFNKTVERKVRIETAKLRDLVVKYEKAATTDPLTGLLNRRGGEDAIVANIARSHRTGIPISFLLLDVDNFKKVNDQHGHGFGDEVLCAIGRAAASTLRISDLAIRWGGEEVLLVLPDTDLEGAIHVAEKVRGSVEALSFDRQLTVTVSIGAAEVSHGEEFHTTIARADMHLYIAKASGRNCIVPRAIEKRA